MLRSLIKKTLKQKHESPKHETSLNMSLNDCMCPICLDIFIEPVRMPCKHEICLSCFETMLDKTNLCCPMCRLRISTWARQATKNHSLVDVERWKKIQLKFPNEIRQRTEGKTQENLLNTLSQTVAPFKQTPSCTEGEIHKEYLDLMRREEERLRSEKENEERLSLAFIEQVIQNEDSLTINDYIEREQRHVHVATPALQPLQSSLSRTNSLRPRRQLAKPQSHQPLVVNQVVPHNEVSTPEPSRAILETSASTVKRRLSVKKDDATAATRSVVTRSQSMRQSTRPRVNLNSTQALSSTPIHELDSSNSNDSTDFTIGRRNTMKKIKK